MSVATVFSSSGDIYTDVSYQSRGCDMVAVLFVCLGNICRSPMAHAILQEQVGQQGLEGLIHHIDSCGSTSPLPYLNQTKADNWLAGAWHEGLVPIVSLS